VYSRTTDLRRAKSAAISFNKARFVNLFSRQTLPSSAVYPDINPGYEGNSRLVEVGLLDADATTEFLSSNSVLAC